MGSENESTATGRRRSQHTAQEHSALLVTRLGAIYFMLHGATKGARQDAAVALVLRPHSCHRHRRVAPVCVYVPPVALCVVPDFIEWLQDA